MERAAASKKPALGSRTYPPVVTMENGSIGQRIRVTEKGTRQTYTAVVVNGGLLQGRL